MQFVLMVLETLRSARIAVAIAIRRAARLLAACGYAGFQCRDTGALEDAGFRCCTHRRLAVIVFAEEAFVFARGGEVLLLQGRRREVLLL